MVRNVVLIALLLVFPPFLPRAAATPNLSPGDLGRLQRGEIVFKPDLPQSEGSQTGNGGTAMALVDADVEAVWRILTDFAHYAGLFPRLKESEVVDQFGTRALVRFHVNVGPFHFRFNIAHVVSWGNRQIRWHLDRTQTNDLFQDTWGYWQLDPLPGSRVLVTYGMASRTVLPAFLTRGSEQDSVVQTIAALKARVERAGKALAN